MNEEAKETALRKMTYGMWVLTDADNEAALRTYRRGGATQESPHVMLTWSFSPDAGVPD